MSRLTATPAIVGVSPNAGQVDAAIGRVLQPGVPAWEPLRILGHIPYNVAHAGSIVSSERHSTGGTVTKHNWMRTQHDC